MIRILMAVLFAAVLAVSAPSAVMAGPEDGQSRLQYDP